MRGASVPATFFLAPWILQGHGRFLGVNEIGLILNNDHTTTSWKAGCHILRGFWRFCHSGPQSNVNDS